MVPQDLLYDEVKPDNSENDEEDEDESSFGMDYADEHFEVNPVSGGTIASDEELDFLDDDLTD